MRISEHFTIFEMIRSRDHGHLAARFGDLDRGVLMNICRLVHTVLQPLRCGVGPLIVTSGFRPPLLNSAVGGSSTSAHLTGCGADIFPTGRKAGRIFSDLRSGTLLPDLPFDRVAYYEQGERLHIDVPPVASLKPERRFYRAEPAWEELPRV